MLVQRCREVGPDPPPGRGLRELLKIAAAQVAARMTAELVGPDEHGVRDEDQRAHPDADTAGEAESLDRVIGQQHGEDEREIPGVPVDVLEDERETGLARVALAESVGLGGGRTEEHTSELQS